MFHPLILLARERARFRFAVLASRMLRDAGASVAEMAPASSDAQRKTVAAVLDYLDSHAQSFPDRLQRKYDACLERGMQTMYRDLRGAAQAAASGATTLMDEALATRQMEIERRVLRLREADQDHLARLNRLIAHLHGETDIRERENPFRPYLMARALYDVLCETTRTTDVCTMLFDHLSGALATHLPEYFAAVLAVFDAHGDPLRLTACAENSLPAAELPDAMHARLTAVRRERARLASSGTDPRALAMTCERIMTDGDDEAVRALAVLADSVPQQAGSMQQMLAGALQERLAGLQVDPRVDAFVVQTWNRVLAHVAAAPHVDSQPLLAVVPDLLWSVQALGEPGRDSLLRLVPTLVRRIRDGLRMIGLPDSEMDRIMDVLVELHAQALRPVAPDTAAIVLSMAEMHRRFSTLNLSERPNASIVAVPLVTEGRLRAALKEQGITAELCFGREPVLRREGYAQWLQALQPGVRVAWRQGDDRRQAVMLAADPQRTFYLFRLFAAEAPCLLVYSAIALIAALREGSVSRLEDDAVCAAAGRSEPPATDGTAVI